MKKEYMIVFLIFLVTLGTRMYFTFESPHFNIESYSIMRHASHIKDAGLPLFSDPLSYGGRVITFTPLFYYMLALSNLILPAMLVYKVIPNLLASTLVIIVFLISYEVSRNKNAALFASFISGFIPIYYSTTINSISVNTLVMPLTFLCIYFFIKIDHDDVFISLFIFSIAALRFVHASVSVFVLALLVYLAFIKIENIKQSKAETELIIFSVFAITWSLFITFKKAFMVHGISVIWLNIPKQILIQYFSEVNILSAVYLIGIIPFVSGIYITYKYVFKDKNKKIYLLTSFAITITILLWFRLIPLNTGLIYLGILLTILFAQYYKIFFNYLKKTRLSTWRTVFGVGLFVCVALTSVIPSFQYAQANMMTHTAKEYEIRALEWIQEYTPDESVILATLTEGHLITAVAHRKNIADSNFLLIDDAQERIKDIDAMFLTPLETETLKLLNKYAADYIYFSPRAKERYDITKLEYAKNSECFNIVYDDQVIIYKVLCDFEER